MNETTCAECGMPQANWGGDGQGYAADGEVYCCQGCAEGTGCTCGVQAGARDM